MSGKSALITGAGKRLGKVMALDLAAHGWNIAVHYNASAGPAEEVAEQVRAQGVEAMTVRADLSDESQVVRVVPAAVDALGPLSLLINSASLFENDTITDATRESWDAHMETNLRAPLVLSQAFAAQVPEPEVGLPGPCIVNILDQRVWNLTPFFMSYTISKYALWGATRNLALALAPRIRVNGIGPGPTLQSIHQTDEQFRRQYEALPLARQTDPKEIAAGVRYIVDTPSMTGQMIALDGGEHLAWGQVAKGTRRPE